MALSVDDVIQHAQQYDAAARHERYMRDRQIKGRPKGQQKPQGDTRGSERANPGGPNLKAQAAQAASQARQVAALKAKLASLRAELQKLLAEARSSSSSSSSSTSSSSKSGGGSKGKSEPKTAAQRVAAKKALEKARRERANQPKKTQTEKTDKPTLTKEEQIAHIRAVIKDVEAKLRAAIEGARTQTASNGR